MNEGYPGICQGLSCPTCSRHKSSHHAPAGLLQPLPVPRRPWSHVSLDFVTGLPPSHGHTAILTIGRPVQQDGPLRALALPKLPSAKETAELMLDTCLPSAAWTSCGRCFRPGSPVHLYLLERVLCVGGGFGQPVVRLSSPVQWSN
ncbi:hypothetical protein L3Q82_007102 [Scortum barcoo]|uniref:Uncharacterized protein n=1 Tax=Scortum barcoo TaxID=214431 RepID=A0ACB8WTG4_9TELE|nr:hypothetical protein L3Q82_007102 [Scortum barcoo]